MQGCPPGEDTAWPPQPGPLGVSFGATPGAWSRVWGYLTLLLDLSSNCEEAWICFENQYPSRVCDRVFTWSAKLKREVRVGMLRNTERKMIVCGRGKKGVTELIVVRTVYLAPSGPRTGKQYWRCGVIRECIYGIGVLAHVRSHQRVLSARDSRAVAMKVGIR